MKRKQDVSGLIFSAFLVIAYVICSYFFISLIQDSTGINDTVKTLLKSLVFVIFGLMLFYATRVGDGKQVRRFSLSTLIVLDLPALYIILASVLPMLPFPLDITKYNDVVTLAAVALGYGIPYTFLSGYELDVPSESGDNTNEQPEQQEGAELDEDVIETDSDSDDEDEDEPDKTEE